MQKPFARFAGGFRNLCPIVPFLTEIVILVEIRCVPVKKHRQYRKAPTSLSLTFSLTTAQFFLRNAA